MIFFGEISMNSMTATALPCSATALQAVMVCLVDTYLKLGPAVLPYLESLDSAQLQLVTTYANRLSQSRAIAVDG